MKYLVTEKYRSDTKASAEIKEVPDDYVPAATIYSVEADIYEDLFDTLDEAKEQQNKVVFT